MIAGLPLRLHEGSISSVTARLSTLNPLSANIRASVKALHLTFHLIPTSDAAGSDEHANLAGSVTSVAESFLHEELTPDEEAGLANSLYGGSKGHPQRHVPGGMDPLPSEESHDSMDAESIPMLSNLVETLLSRFQFEAEDTRLTIVHPGHASFTAEIPEIRYHTEFRDPTSSGGQALAGDARTVTVTGLTVRTHSLRVSSPPVSASPAILSPPSPHSPVSQGSQHEPRRASPTSQYTSDSDMDDDVAMAMSQSVVGLPPRPPSPSMSATSSMYLSAIAESTTEQGEGDVEDNHAHTPGAVSTRKHSTESSSTARSSDAQQSSMTNAPGTQESEIVLSFALDPIVVQLTRVFPISQQTQADSTLASPSATSSAPRPDGGSAPSAAVEPPAAEKLRFSVSAGVIATALRARHISDILNAINLISRPANKAAPSGTSSSGSSALPNGLDASLRIRGIVMLLLPPREPPDSSSDEIIKDFFGKPLLPPRCQEGYVRGHIDTISATLTTNTPPSRRKGSISRVPTAIKATATVKDITVFAFWNDATDAHEGPVASPIFISDPYLPSQYTSDHQFPDRPQQARNFTDSPSVNAPLPSHPRLPTFIASDWTSLRTRSIRLSQWRTKPPQLSQRLRTGAAGMANSVRNIATSPTDSAASPEDGGEAEHSPIISVKVAPGPAADAESNEIEVDVKFAPVHAFIDMDLILGSKSGVNAFIDCINDARETTTPMNSPGDSLDNDEESEVPDEPSKDSPPVTPRMRPVGMPAREWERQEERRRLEQLVLDDLDLAYDYRQPPRTASSSKLAHAGKPLPKVSYYFQITSGIYFNGIGICEPVRLI
jgi:autophagy-related protein 2